MSQDTIYMYGSLVLRTYIEVAHQEAKDAFVSVVGGRTEANFTLVIAASNTYGLLYSTTVKGGVNAERFNTSLDSASHAAGPHPVTFLFDNSPCHRRAHEACFREHHNFKHLPAYSLFLNITENTFSVWKASNEIRRKCESKCCSKTINLGTNLRAEP